MGKCGAAVLLSMLGSVFAPSIIKRKEQCSFRMIGTNLRSVRRPYFQRMVKEEKRKAEECDSVAPERNDRKKMRVIKEEEAEELHYVPLTRKGMKKMRGSEDGDSDDEPGRKEMRGLGVWREDSESLVVKKSVSNGLMEISDELRCKRSDGKKWRCGARAMPERIYCENHYIQMSKRQGGRERTSKMKKGHKGVASDLLDQKGQTKISENPPQAQQDVVKRKSRNLMKRKVRDDEVDVRNYDSEDSERRFEGRKKKIKGEGARKPGNRRIVGGSLMCHQCQRNDKGRVVWCSQCNKRYCVCCIERCYPEQPEEEIANACPFCRGNRNCKACLRRGLLEVKLKEVTEADKINYLHHLISTVIPVLTKIKDEQKAEQEMEAKIHGILAESLDVPCADICSEERLYCDNCSTSIVDLHRSYQDCSYDLCLTCCRELREGCQPGGDEAQSSQQQFSKRVSRENVETATSKGRTGLTLHLQSPNSHTVNRHQPLPDWKANKDSSLPCPPKERGGCGSNMLNLKSIFSFSWVPNLLRNAQQIQFCGIPLSFKKSDPCSLCSKSNSQYISEFSCKLGVPLVQGMPAMSFLYCPTAQDLKKESLQRFQQHWAKGEPVIVQNVLEDTAGLSWEPMVM